MVTELRHECELCLCARELGERVVEICRLWRYTFWLQILVLVLPSFMCLASLLKLSASISLSEK